MSRKGFDTVLFKESLRQLRLPGIVLFVISMFGCLIVPVLYALSRGTSSASAGSTAFTVSAALLAPFAAVMLYLIPLVLVLSLFRPFHTRSGADFYHSLASTRTSLYISMGAAALAWYYAIAAASVLGAAALYAALGASFAPAYLPYVLFTCLAGGTLVSAVALLAVSMTGTILNTLVLAGLVAFLPRLVTTLFTAAITRSLSFVGFDALGAVGRYSLNIPAGFLLSAVASFIGNTSGNTADTPFLSGAAIAYTYVLAGIYLVLGWLAFRTRRSETAGANAPNRLLQHIYRCVIALPVGLLIPFVLVSERASGSGIFCIVLGIVDVFIYFLYELITTKKLKNLLTAAPVLPVVAAVCVVFGMGLRGVQSNLLSLSFTADDIASVQLAADGGGSSSSSNTTPTYNDLLTKTIRYTESDIRTQVADDYAAAVKKLTYNLSDAGKNQSTSYSPTYSAVIHLKNGRTVTRYLGMRSEGVSDMSDDPFSALQETMLKNALYSERAVALPEQADIQSVYSNLGKSRAAAERIWEVYKGEYAKLTSEQQLSLQQRMNSAYDNTDNVGNLYVEGTYQLESFYEGYAISSTLTPKAAQMAVDLTNTEDTVKQAKQMIAGLMNATKDDKLTYYCYFQLYSPSSGTEESGVQTGGNDITLPLSGDWRTAFTIAQGEVGKTVDVSKPFLCLNLSSTADSGAQAYTSAYIPLTDAEYRQFGALNLSH